MAEPEYTGQTLDAAAIRVLAHPLRSRVLSWLRTRGPATATGLAAALSTNTGATSYHLRKLESGGLVADTGEGEGKQRLWRAATDFHAWTRSAFAADEDTTTALGWLEHDYVRQAFERAQAWVDAAEQWPAAWVDVLGLNDTILTVTPAQLGALRREIDAVLVRYRHAGDGEPDARRVTVFDHASPLDPAPPARDDPGEADRR